ncbi:MAG: cob(I)yrinic acid a,c-diamide adenosyltransferase [Gammaproteobacteria bacterium]|nr:cob(I)yrinic acid a,c-diamide adenosyltransferase [Gammaproteobacteria bacterium]
MGHRLSKIYTRTGDDGSTGLGDGTRVAKDHARIEAIGAVDELNSAIGLVLCEDLPDSIGSALIAIQHRLFDLGGELSVPGRQVMQDQQVGELETLLDELNSALDPLKEFVLPGGTRAAALCHLARSVCRRAERRAYGLAKREPVSPVGLRYLNRLSDLLFVMARALNRAAGHGDVLWRPAEKPRG